MKSRYYYNSNFRDINEMSEDKFVETHIQILRAVKENKKMHID
jgi:hypothetical protein